MTTAQKTNPQDSALITPEPYGPIVLRLDPVVQLTDEQLVELCALNDVLRIERNAQGDLELMPPTLPGTGNQEASITIDLGIWARGDGRGVVFSPTAGFTLPNGAVRSPDASWILKARLAELTDEEKRGFAHICPDFVIELRSSSDSLRSVRRKMEEYLENGVRLGWLIDPLDPQRRVYIYRPNLPVEILERPETLSGEPVLPGFTLDLKPVWEPAFLS